MSYSKKNKFLPPTLCQKNKFAFLMKTTDWVSKRIKITTNLTTKDQKTLQIPRRRMTKKPGQVQ